MPEALANEAREAGLLEPERRARLQVGRVLQQLHSVTDEPMSMADIQAEVDSVRERAVR